MDKKNSRVFSAVAVPMSVAVAVVVVVAAGIMCFVANGGEGAADGLLPTPALIGTDREHAGLAGSDTLFRFESRVANLGRIRVGHKNRIPLHQRQFGPCCNHQGYDQLRMHFGCLGQGAPAARPAVADRSDL